MELTIEIGQRKDSYPGGAAAAKVTLGIGRPDRQGCHWVIGLFILRYCSSLVAVSLVGEQQARDVKAPGGPDSGEVGWGVSLRGRPGPDSGCGYCDVVEAVSKLC